MNPYQTLFGSMWPTAPKHEQFPRRNPQKEEQKSEVIDLTPTDGSRKPNAWYRKDFQENCVRILPLLRNTPGLTLRGISGLVGRQEYHLMPALQALNRCGYIAARGTSNGLAAWFITEKGNDYLKK